jgi:hypothetical protein
MIAAKSYCGKNVFFVTRNYDSDGNLTIIRSVGCVEGATAGVKADFSAKMTAESGFKRSGVELRGIGQGWGDVRRHGYRTSSRKWASGARELKKSEVGSHLAALRTGRYPREDDYFQARVR